MLLLCLAVRMHRWTLVHSAVDYMALQSWSAGQRQFLHPGLLCEFSSLYSLAACYKIKCGNLSYPSSDKSTFPVSFIAWSSRANQFQNSSLFFSFVFVFLSFLLLSTCITINTAQSPKMTVMASFVADGHWRRSSMKWTVCVLFLCLQVKAALFQ